MAAQLGTAALDATLMPPPEHPDGWVLGRNQAVKKVALHAQRAAEVQCTVLVSGETGTGKEVWARLLHKLGPRRDRVFIPVNCAALTATLAESQLFGHEKGAFTGAAGSALGVFRAAAGGVIFLDEVGEMPLDLQPKLLRVLQESEVTPVGSATPSKVDVQIIAATNRSLEAEVEKGTFREDLFYRLNMVELNVPSLRERPEDIPEFVEFFSRRFAAKYNRDIWKPTAEEAQAFCEYLWPGNVRQLSHVIEQAYVLDCAPTLPNTNPRRGSTPALPFMNLSKLRRTAVMQAMQTTRGHKSHAARLLGVHPNTMTRLLSQIENESEDEQSSS